MEKTQRARSLPARRQYLSGLELVELFPTLARRRIKQGVGGLIVSNLPGLRIELDRAAEPLGDHPKIEYLG